MVLPSELPLPDECIDLIVAYLVKERQALYALVCSSQRLLERTLPILYRSPFQLIESTRRWSAEEKEKRCTALLALLLKTRRPDTSRSTAMNAYTHHHQQQQQQQQQNRQNQQSHPLTAIDYLRFFTHQCHADLYRPLVKLRFEASEENAFILDVSQKMIDLQISVAQSLIQYCPEDIKLIGLPMSRVDSVLMPSLEYLRNLVRLELSEIACNYKIEPVIEFIRVHDAIYHTLREIKVKGPEDPSHPSHKELYRLVQAMRWPQVVDARHWQEAISVLDHIPPECLRTLLLGMANMPPPNLSVPRCLSQCHFLEELRMPVRDERLFEWAMVRPRQLSVDRNGALSRSRSLPRGSSSSSMFSSQSAPSATSYPGIMTSSSSFHWQQNLLYPEWQTSEEPQGPARLKSIELCGEDRYLIPALQDAVDAFQDSLEILKAMSLAPVMPSGSIVITMSLTWSWPLSRLTVLDLEGEVALAFELSALKYCPALITLKLALPSYLHSTSEDGRVMQEMKSKMSHMFYASRLLDLELHGKWPVSDALLQMLTQRMRRLTNLYIVNCLGYTIEGVKILTCGLERLERLAISKWLCAGSPMQHQLQAIRAQRPVLELIEM
ncbi:hypothetical protein BGX28_004842 [Mortierella sp. GBA30]|nr:hypothetical protein BGX28_004842 [Mortierella sp. GBA30]